MTEEILIAILMLALSFFFAGMEIAFLSSNRLKIELKTVQGNRAGRILSYFKKKTSEVLITILIGNNLALVVFTLMMNQILDPYMRGSLGLNATDNYLSYTFIQTTISTLIVLILAEYLPKAIFRRNADRLVFPGAYVLNVFFWLLRLPVMGINTISKFLLRILFRVASDERIVELGKTDLDHYIQEMIAAGEDVSVPELDTEMLTNALAFKETKAREFMIPRTDIVALPLEATIPELIDVFVENQLSKIIIYDDSLDSIKGFVHASGMFQKPDSIRAVIQPVLIVPETMPANMLLAELTGNQRSVAIVVDEFGGTAGMITMEDLVEEVFGEIEDEHDFEKEEVVEADMVKVMNEDGSYVLGGRLEIDDLNEEFGFHLPEEEYYTTLGGLLLYVAENIPNQEESFQIEEYLLTVIDATPTRVISVRLTPLGPGE